LDIATYKRTREIVERYGFHLKKKLGQNFLIDSHSLNKIIASAEISQNDVIIEIGPGIGSMTEKLLEHSHKVIAIEIDKNLIPILEENLKGFENLEIINEDVLKADINKVIGEYENYNIKVIANLPYYITTPIVVKLLENRYRIQSLVVMVQKEVASRMTAEPGTKDYGSLSLFIKYYTAPYLVANVPSNCFFPRPKVDSAVVKLLVKDKDENIYGVKDEACLFKLIKASFGQRRKTLVNCIFNNFDFSKEEIQDMLEQNGFNKDVRGESLGIEDFVLIANTLTANFEQ